MYRGSWSWLKRKHGIRLPISKVLHLFFSFFSSFPFLFFSSLCLVVHCYFNPNIPAIHLLLLLLLQLDPVLFALHSKRRRRPRPPSLSDIKKLSRPIPTINHQMTDQLFFPPIDFQFEMLKLSSNIFNSLI